MFRFLLGLKDPWKLLVSALVTANLIAIVAVIMMYRNKSEAQTAKDEVEKMLAAVPAGELPESKSLFAELKKIHKIRDLQVQSQLSSTKKHAVMKYLEEQAQHVQFEAKHMIDYSDDETIKTDVSTLRIHRWKYLCTEEIANNEYTRKSLAMFLFNVKTKTPQIKIESIKFGSRQLSHPDGATTMRPEIVFKLIKEDEEKLD